MKVMSFFKIGIIFSLVTLLSKFIGLYRDSLLAHNFGTSNITDAYNVAISIPSLMYQILGTAVMTSFIPYYKESVYIDGQKRANEFANKVTTLLLIIMAILLSVMFIRSDIVAMIFAPNFNSETLHLTSNLIKISLINMIFMASTNIACGILQSQGRFLSTSFMGLILNIPIVSYMLLQETMNIYMLTFFTSIGYIMQLLIQIPSLRKINYAFKFNIQLNDKRLIQLIKGIIPILIGVGFQQISVIVDKIMGSSLEEGTITILDFSIKINGVVYAVIVTSILTILYPKISSYVVENKGKELNVEFQKYLLLLLIILLPVCMLVIILSEDIISIIFEGGKFSKSDTIITAQVLSIYIIATPFTAVRDLVAQVYYSMKDTKTPAIYGIIAVVVNVILNITFTPIWGIKGIAISTTISLILTSCILFLKLNKLIGNVNKRLIIDLIKIVVSLIVTYFLVGYLRKNYIFLVDSSKFELIIYDSLLCFSAFFIYLLLAFILNVGIVRNYSIKIFNKFLT